MTAPVDDRPRLLMVMPYRQFVRKAQAEGFWVGAIWDPRLESPEYLDDVRALADVFVTADFRDEELLRRTIREVAEEHRASVIYHIGREETMAAAYEVAEELHIEVNPAEAVRLLTDKHAMRDLLAARGMSPVSFEAVATRREVPDAVRRIGRPAVVKPTALAGSRGVFLWQEEADLAVWTVLVEEYGYDGPFLVEEYLRGPEYSVETLSRDGEHRIVGITEKLLGAPPLFVEVGHVHPAPLPPERRRAVEDLTTELLTACGYRFGPAHTEVIWTEAAPASSSRRPGSAGTGSHASSSWPPASTSSRRSSPAWRAPRPGPPRRPRRRSCGSSPSRPATSTRSAASTRSPGSGTSTS